MSTAGVLGVVIVVLIVALTLVTLSAMRAGWRPRRRRWRIEANGNEGRDEP